MNKNQQNQNLVKCFIHMTTFYMLKQSQVDTRKCLVTFSQYNLISTIVKLSTIPPVETPLRISTTCIVDSPEL